MSLKDKMLKSGSIKNSSVLAESEYFNEQKPIKTNLPILNVAFSGDLDGGLVSGLTIISGNPGTFKSLTTIYCMKAYLDYYEDAVALFYDSEFGITNSYLYSIGVDTERVIHIPIADVEEMKFDLVKRLGQIEKDDNVFIMVDSLGSLASKKEVEDAVDEKSVADMTRAKAIRSMLRIITPHLTMKDIPCVMVNHVYKEIGSMYPQDVIPGGTAVTFAANQVWIITKAQEKEGTELVGNKFTINIHKSRFVKQKAKFPFIVNYKSGIDKWSGLLDIAIETGHIVQSKKGWYNRVDSRTGEIIEPSMRRKQINTKDFWDDVMNDKSFKESVKSIYSLGVSGLDEDEYDIPEEEETEYEE